MKGEVRGLLSKLYASKEHGCALQVTTSDDAISILLLDVDSDIFYDWQLSTNGKVKDLCIGSITQAMLEEQDPY